MTMKQFETVYALVDVPAARVHAGQAGTVLDIYEDGAMEIEFDEDEAGGLVTASLQSSQVSATPLRRAA